MYLRKIIATVREIILWFQTRAGNSYRRPWSVARWRRAGLLARKRGRLLAAGRCLSSDREVNSALRVQATCMACGQAAAVLAAQAVRENIAVMDVDMNGVYEILRQHKAIVPE